MHTFATLSDLHIRRGARWEEGRRVHQAAREVIRARRPDGVLVAGDIHDARSDAEERLEGASLFIDLAEDAEVVGIYGNHDVPRDLDIYNLLGAKHPIHFYYRPAVHVIGDVAIAMLPWEREPPTVEMLALSGAARRAAEEAARTKMLTDLADALDATGARTKLVVGHLMLREAKVSVGQPERRGTNFEMTLAELGLLRAHGYILGHVHASQDWKIGDAPVAYSGSTTRRTYGEIERKYLLLIHCEGPLVSFEWIELPATPMVLVDTRWAELEPGVFGWTSDLNELLDDASGADVRFSYEVDEAHRTAAAVAATAVLGKLRARGAKLLKAEETVKTILRAKAPDIARTTDLEEKLAITLVQKGYPRDTDQHKRVVVRFREMMTERA